MLLLARRIHLCRPAEFRTPKMFRANCIRYGEEEEVEGRVERVADLQDVAKHHHPVTRINA
jgi:hypothetical protein